MSRAVHGLLRFAARSPLIPGTIWRGLEIKASGCQGQALWEEMNSQFIAAETT